MTVNHVLQKYHAIVPFPWTIANIRKSGQKVGPFFFALGRDLDSAEDNNLETFKKAIDSMVELHGSELGPYVPSCPDCSNGRCPIP